MEGPSSQQGQPFPAEETPDRGPLQGAQGQEDHHRWHPRPVHELRYVHLHGHFHVRCMYIVCICIIILTESSIDI